MSDEDQKELYKLAVKEAIHEWLEKKFATFGKWSLRGIAAAVFALFLKWLVSQGIDITSMFR